MHKFSYLWNFNRSWSSRRCFWRRLRAVWVISRSRQKPQSRRRSVSCDRVNIHKTKLRNFDRPLRLPGHLQWSFLMSTVSSLRNTTVQVRGNCRCRTIRVVWSSPAMFLTSATCHLFEKRWRESMITAIAVSRGACRHRLHFTISWKSTILHVHRPARRTSSWHLPP